MGLAPIEAVARGLLSPSALGPDYYPPALTGIRGNHEGSFEVAHAVARGGRHYSRPARQTDADYDLIVVGGGISGLSAAKLFRDRRDGPSKILVLDNHDDFGGHARRNEFVVDGRTLIGYGGSQTIENPSKYSIVAKQLLKDLAIDVDRFYEFYDRTFFSRREMGYDGVYFDKATFGRSRISANPIGGIYEALDTTDIAPAVATMPIGEDDKREFLRLLTSGVDYLDGRTVEEKRKTLRNISYLDFLDKYAGVPVAVREILRDCLLPLNSVGWEADTALYAAEWDLPGTAELGVREPDDDDPYIHHFPDGNAGIARSLVRDLVPDAIPGSTMEDIVTARANYSRLDSPDSDARIRLNSTAVEVRNSADGKFVDVTYVNNGETFRVRGRNAILACYNSIIPYICSEMPAAQTEAIRYATKVPFVLGSIALRNWRAFAAAGFRSYYSPGDVYFKHLGLDFPVSMGDYHYPQSPDEPIMVSAWYSPTTRGLPARDQYRAGQRRLLHMRYADFEANIFSHLDGMLGPHGFDADRDIAGITLNRWPHGYAYEFEGLGVPAGFNRYNGPHVAGRAQIGRISIANSDAEAYAYVNGAIDAADRAVNEQLRNDT